MQQRGEHLGGREHKAPQQSLPRRKGVQAASGRMRYMLVDCTVQIHVGTLSVEISDLISKYYKTDLMQTNLNNNNIRELNRIVERYGGLERCGRLDYFGWLGYHCCLLLWKASTGRHSYGDFFLLVNLIFSGPGQSSSRDVRMLYVCPLPVKFI